MPTTIEITNEGGQIAFLKNSPNVYENSNKGVVVGTVLADDQDAVEGLKLSLDSDANGRFSVAAVPVCSNVSSSGAPQHTICRAHLLVAGALDYEVNPSLSIIVRATDKNGLHRSEPFSVTISDRNDKPTDITLTGSTVKENLDNFIIASLQTQDQDIGQTHRSVSQLGLFSACNNTVSYKYYRVKIFSNSNSDSTVLFAVVLPLCSNIFFPTMPFPTSSCFYPTSFLCHLLAVLLRH